MHAPVDNEEKRAYSWQGRGGTCLEAGNEASVVLELKDGAFQMLLTGDLEGRGEEQLVESGALESCPILKAGHHGSKNSGSEEFSSDCETQININLSGDRKPLRTST